MSVRRAVHRGAVLLEMLIAMALFVGAASMLSQLQASINNSLERARLRVEAMDLARKALAELEAGIITVSDLRSLHLRTEQSTLRQDRALSTEDLANPSPWIASVRTERSPYEGLTLVELTVTHTDRPGERALVRDFGPDEEREADDVTVTVRQLVRLRDDADEEALAGRP